LNKFESASILAGMSPNEEPQVSEPTNLHVITGEVVANSENGTVLVSMDGLVFSEDDTQYIEMDTIGGLEEGDEATIILAGETGSSMTPLAIGSTGSVDRLSARVIETELLIADKADIEDLEAATARIGDLESDHVSVDTLEAATARIETLEVDHVSVADFEVEQANIDTLQAATADIDTIRANSAKVQNLTAAQLEADHATIGTLDTTYMHADMANADVAWIQNGTIKNGAIVSAMINDVSANKLTAGTINGSVINVTNLNADNITAGTINGQRIGTGSLSLDKLSEDVYTESEVNTIVDGLNDRIDGAIETHTGTAVPTLNNSPASSWNTTALKDEHVGDVYYVVNSQSQQNGYCYRFTKSGSTYSWQLIKDSDVTAALSRLTTAEGKITSIESFDSTVSSFMTNTDSELTSVKSRATSLETRMTDAEGDISEKVDTSTFNTLSQTVDGNSASITSMSTVLSNNGLTSSTNITNTVNTVSQTASGNSSKITQLTTTLGTNADGTTKAGDVMHRTSAIEQDVNSFKTTVSETYATKTELDETVDNRVVVDGEFLYRTTGGEQDVPSGRATVQSIKGNTLVWNQIYPNENYSGGSSSTRTRNFDASTGVLTITNAEVPTSNTAMNTSNAFTLISGHKYYFPQFFIEDVTSRPEIYLYSTTSAARIQDAPIFLYSGASEEAIVVRLLFRANTVTATWTYYMQLFDLTAMFGAGNEPSTVAEFEALFPEPYYPYDSGSLLPVRMEGVETVGFNLLDLSSPRFGGNYNRAVGASMKGNPSNVFGENPCTLVVTSAWGGVTYVAEVLSGQRYHSQSTFAAGTSGNARVTEYLLDSEFKVTRRLGNYSQNYTISHDITVQDGERYYAISYLLSAAGTMTLTDTILNFSGPRNGTYEPHWRSERAIPASTYFPDGMRSAGSVRDELTTDELVTRVGAVDLGTLTWTYETSGTVPFFRSKLPSDYATPTTAGIDNLECAKYEAGPSATRGWYGSNERDKTVRPIYGQNYNVGVQDSTYTDAEAFKTAMSGVMLHYELATPTIMTIDQPLNMTYRAESGGTERIMVDATLAVPQSAPAPMSIQYGINIYETAAEDALRTASIESRVTTAESTIEQHGASIALKANSADVYTKSGVDGLISTEVTNRNAAITAKANEIASTVSQTYTTKEEFENLEIGGRNLLPTVEVWENGTWNSATGVHSNRNTRIRSSKDGWYITIEPSETYVLSRHSISDSKTYHAVLYAYDSSGSYVSTDSVTAWITEFPYSYEPKTATRLEVGIRNSKDSAVEVSEASIARFKLEKGNKATDWTPAPEDIETRVSSAESSITQNANNIALKVSESDVTGNYVVGKINLNSTTATIAAQHINLQGAVTISDLASDASTALADASKTATSYVTEITGQNGIMVHPSTDDDTGVRITSDVDIRQDNASIANFGALDSNNNPTARVGKADDYHVAIDTDSLDVMDGTTTLASFGSEVLIGPTNDNHIEIGTMTNGNKGLALGNQSGYELEITPREFFSPWSATPFTFLMQGGNQQLDFANSGVEIWALGDPVESNYAKAILKLNARIATANQVGSFTFQTNAGSNTWSTPAGTILWSGTGWHMTAGHTANLSHNVSTCPTGIVLHFQPCTSSTVQNYNHIYHFVPKTHVASYNGAGIVVHLGNPDFSNIASKYLYISNDHITGNNTNNTTGTNSGITYNNAAWVMTQVIAV